MTPVDAVAAIACEHLKHRYGDLVAVDDLTLRVERGEVLGLLGPNGAGKTTTIRVLNTLVPVQQGSVAIFGLDVMRRALDVRCNLGYVPQQLSVEGRSPGART